MIRKNDKIEVFKGSRQVHTWVVVDLSSLGGFRVRTEKGDLVDVTRHFAAEGFKTGRKYRLHRKGDSWWVPRFDSFAEASRHMFDIVPEGGVDGTSRFGVLNVPIMKTYTSRDTHCDEAYLDRMVANFHMPIQATAHLAGGGSHGGSVADKFGFRPKVHLHHTTDDPGGFKPEVVGHIQDMYRAGPFIMADLGGLDSHSLGKLRAGKYPDRSPEVDPKRGRILSVALLGAECPHFAFPQMRHFGFRDEVQKHGSTEPRVYHRFKGDELMNIYTPFSVLDRFRRLPEGDPKRKQFEALLHEHMQGMQASPPQPDMGGGAGVMGGTEQMEAMIRKVVMQMQADRFNTTPTPASPQGAGAPMYSMAPAASGMVPGATGATGAAVPTPQHFSRAVDEILDLEDNYSHHASSGVDPDELEPGTKVETSAESPTEPMPGPQAGDAGVTQRGQPSSAEPKDRGVDEYNDQADESGLTKNDLEVATRTVRHAMESSSVDDQTSAALDVLVRGQEKISRHFNLLVRANKVLNGRVAEQSNEIERRKQLERHQGIRSKLTRMRLEGYVSVGDEPSVERHAGLIGSMTPEQESVYFENIRLGGKVRPGERVRFVGSSDSSPQSPIAESVERHRAELEGDRDLREAAQMLGIDAEDLALGGMWAELEDRATAPIEFGG